MAAISRLFAVNFLIQSQPYPVGPAKRVVNRGCYAVHVQHPLVPNLACAIVAQFVSSLNTKAKALTSPIPPAKKRPSLCKEACAHPVTRPPGATCAPRSLRLPAPPRATAMQRRQFGLIVAETAWLKRRARGQQTARVVHRVVFVSVAVSVSVKTAMCQCHTAV